MHYMFTDYLQHKTYENLQKLLHDYETLAKAQLLIWQRLRREALVGITPQQKEIGTMHSANPSLCRTQTEAERPVVTTISTCNHLPELGSLKASSGA